MLSFSVATFNFILSFSFSSYFLLVNCITTADGKERRDCAGRRAGQSHPLPCNILKMYGYRKANSDFENLQEQIAVSTIM